MPATDTVPLGAPAPLTKAEKDLERARKEILERNPLFYHQCDRPTAAQIPANAKERQVWTCGDCGAQYRLTFMAGLKGQPGEAFEPDQQACWVRM